MIPLPGMVKTIEPDSKRGLGPAGSGQLRLNGPQSFRWGSESCRGIVVTVVQEFIFSVFEPIYVCCVLCLNVDGFMASLASISL